ncbi:MAG: hypothetical protein ACE5KA_04030 [Nitrososphaerales archaeon]
MQIRVECNKKASIPAGISGRSMSGAFAANTVALVVSHANAHPVGMTRKI